MKNFNPESFLSDLFQVNWDQIFEFSREVNEAVKNWSTHLSFIIEKPAPMKVSNKFTPWLTTELKENNKNKE